MSRALSLEEIDRRLTQWQSDANALHSNFLDSQSQTGYSLAGEGATLSGKTLTLFRAAKEAESRLLTDMLLFDEHLERIKAKRSQLNPINPINRSKLIEELSELFLGESVPLPAETISFKDRSLFDNADRTSYLQPETLRRRMQEDFSHMQAFFVKLGEAWQGFNDQKEALKPEIAALRSQLAAYGLQDHADFTALMARLESTSKRWRSNPLEVTEDLRTDLKPYLEKAALPLRKIEQDLQNLPNQLSQAATRLEELMALRVKALETEKRYLQVCGNSATGCKPPPSLKALRETLAAIKQKYAEGDKFAVRKALSEWQASYEQLALETRLAFEQNQKAAAKPDAIKQRLIDAQERCRGLQAQGMAIPTSVKTFEQAAVNILATLPLDIEALDKNVYALEVKLSELATAFQKHS